MSVYLTIAQVARVAKLSRRTIDLKIEKGLISTVLHGSKRMVQVEELLRVFPNVRAEEIENELNNKQAKQESEVRTPDAQNADYEFRLLRMELKFKQDKIDFLEIQIEELKNIIKELKDEVRRTADERIKLQEQTNQSLNLVTAFMQQKQISHRTKSTQAANRKRDAAGKFVSQGDESAQ